jgi:hypothetical protein
MMRLLSVAVMNKLCCGATGLAVVAGGHLVQEIGLGQVNDTGQGTNYLPLRIANRQPNAKNRHIQGLTYDWPTNYRFPLLERSGQVIAVQVVDADSAR